MLTTYQKVDVDEVDYALDFSSVNTYLLIGMEDDNTQRDQAADPQRRPGLTVQAHGYSGLNFRHLAEVVGIKSASIHYHFPTKADLGAAVAKRYWEDTAAVLEAMLGRNLGSDPLPAPISRHLSQVAGE